MRTLILLLLPLFSLAQKSNFIASGITAASSAALIVGANKYSQKTPQRGYYKDDYSYIQAQRQHLKSTRAIYATGIISGAFSVVQLTMGTVKLIKRKNTLVEINANSVYLTLNF